MDIRCRNGIRGKGGVRLRKISWYILWLSWAALTSTVFIIAVPAGCTTPKASPSANKAGNSVLRVHSGSISLSATSDTKFAKLAEEVDRPLPTKPSAGSTAIGGMKFLPDGSEVAISQKIVTYVQEDKLYVQEIDRSSGIRASNSGYPLPVMAGDVVSFSGVLTTVNMEREIQIAGAVTVHLTDAPLPEPLGMQTRYLVGGPFNTFTPGIPGSPETNTVGLRTAIWGYATSDMFVDDAGYWCFYLDDGSNIRDGTIVGDPPTEARGVRVYSYIAPPIGEFKVVRGVCGIIVIEHQGSPKPIRCVRTYGYDDIYDPGSPGTPTPTGDVSGTVRLVGATSPRNARIYACKSSVRVPGVGDTAAAFLLRKIPTTSALITASAPGYYSQSRLVSAGMTDVEIELLPASRYLHMSTDKDSIRVCDPNISLVSALIRDSEGKGLPNQMIKITTTKGVFAETGLSEITAESDECGYVHASLSTDGAGTGIALLLAKTHPDQTQSANASVIFTGALMSVSSSPVIVDANEPSTISALLQIEDTPIPDADVVFTTDAGGFDESSGAATCVAKTGQDGIAQVSIRLPEPATANVMARYLDSCGNEAFGWTVVARRSVPWQTVGVQQSSPLIDQLIQTPDGSRQIAVVTSQGQLVVWRADGTLAWQQSVGCTNNTPSCGDIDGDPATGLEIAIPTEDQQKMFVYSAATGTKFAGWPASSKWPFKLVAAALADVNLDGSLEVLCGDQSCYVFAWNSTGDWKGNNSPEESFLWRNLTGSTGTAILGSTVAIGDITGNGIPEAVVGASQAPDVYSFPGDAWGDHATPPIRPPLYTPDWPKGTDDRVESSPAIGDIDGDGHNDFAVGCDSGSVYMYLSSDGTWRGHACADQQIKSSIALADLDGDGKLDVIVGADNGRVYAINYLGHHIPGWDSGILLSTEGHPVRSSPVVADINGDGSLDVIVGCSNGFVYAIYSEGRLHKDALGQATGPFLWVKCAIPLGVSSAEVLSTPVIDDLDGNGKLDLIVCSTGGVFWFALDTDMVRDDAHMPWPTFHRDNARSGYFGNEPTLRYASIVGRVTKNDQPILGAKVHITFADDSQVPVPHSDPVTYRSHVLTVGQELQTEANKGAYSINQLEPELEYKLRVESTGNPDKIVGPFTANLGLNRIDISLSP